MTVSCGPSILITTTNIYTKRDISKKSHSVITIYVLGVDNPDFAKYSDSDDFGQDPIRTWKAWDWPLIEID